MLSFTVLNSLAFILIGILSGSLGALLGIGGGVINVPFMLQFGLSPEVARSAGLILSSLTGISAFISHRRRGNVESSELLPFMIFAIIGVVIGVSFQFIFRIAFPAYNYARLFKIIFLFVLVVALLRMLGQYYRKIFHGKIVGIRQNDSNHNNHERESDENTVKKENSFWFKAFIAVPGGFLAGVLGIGGGVYYGPILKTVAHYPIKRAIPLSSGLIAVSVPVGAVIAHIIYIIQGNIHQLEVSLLAALFIGTGTLFGVYFGAVAFKRIKSGFLSIIYIALISYNIIKLIIGII